MEKIFSGYALKSAELFISKFSDIIRFKRLAIKLEELMASAVSSSYLERSL